MAAGAAAAGAVRAVRAMGVMVIVEPGEFSKLMDQVQDPLIVVGQGGFGLFGRNYKYLMSYKGLTFFTKSTAPLALPDRAEIVNARRIWIPGG
jgi:hypothetical protein